MTECKQLVELALACYFAKNFLSSSYAWSAQFRLTLSSKLRVIQTADCRRI
jgi:hypothetical protein